MQTFSSRISRIVSKCKTYASLNTSINIAPRSDVNPLKNRAMTKLLQTLHIFTYDYIYVTNNQGSHCIKTWCI